MSRYAPSDYRPARDRSRSPPRFSDRRPSVASVGYGSRASDLTRGGGDAPRGPRSQFDGGRPPLGSGPSGPGPSRGGYAGRGEIRELRDAPPLGSDRGGRPSFKDREFDRRERIPSPRGRSPPRNFRDPRDYPPPRELDIPPRARRSSRDGPPSAGSTYPDPPAPFGSPASSSFRGGFRGGRGRGGGDFDYRESRAGRGGRRNLDDRDLFVRRDRSPPLPPASRWPRDARDSRDVRDAREVSRDAREPERRDERRFDRRDEERRPDWPVDRERDIDRSRRDPPQPRLENRASNDSLASGASHPPPAPHVNPDRLALLESAGADTSIRRPSLTPSTSSAREHRREQPEIPAYLNGRAETTNNRYGSRGSSPPTQAPPVPAFTLSFASQGGAPAAAKAPQEPKHMQSAHETHPQEPTRPTTREKPAVPAEIPTAPRAAPHVAKAQAAEPPPAAPKAPRALGIDNDSQAPSMQRPHPPRSWEGNPQHDTSAAIGRGDAPGSQHGQQPPVPQSPNPSNGRLPQSHQPTSPAMQHNNRLSDLSAPTGPKASRQFPNQPAASPRMPFVPPQGDNPNVPGPPTLSRPKTPPPPTAPSGPRNRAFSVSPKVTGTSIPTAPKANRAPPLAPRGLERAPAAPARAPERGNAMQARVPPSAPTAPRQPQWNQWRRPGAPVERSVPAKRDSTGEEKRRPSAAPSQPDSSESQPLVKTESSERPKSSGHTATGSDPDRMDVDEAHPKKQRASISHSAQQSFFGKPLEKSTDDSGMSDAPEEAISSSEDDDLEIEDPALFEAKFERQKRELESQLVDLSSKSVRATTPLESIARLARVSTKDLERFRERESGMELDEPHAPADKQPTSDESEESVVTPKGEDTASVAIQDGEEDVPSARRMRRASPEVVNLPYLFKEPPAAFHETWQFKDTLEREEENKEAVLSALKHEVAEEHIDENDLEATFAAHYRRWRQECERLDQEREAEERLERQQSDEPGPELEVSPNPAPLNPVAEGRRLHKYSSEYDVQQVLKQSEETARLEQEKQDIELKKSQADMEKEAIVPDQMTLTEFQRSCFIDNNRLCDPRSLTRVFTYQPAADNFTDHEQQIFIAAYKETPKKWSEIATLLPGRAARDCIRHYYANKWDGRFKDNRRRKYASRRGRGAKAVRGRTGAAMADMARVEELGQNVSDSGRPKRAAAPTTFGEKEIDAKNALAGQSPAKKSGSGKHDGETATEKPVKRRKGTGEKPGRKPKVAAPPLAPIAAAPSLSPNARFVPGIPQQKDDPAMIQSLAEASLLTGFHTSSRNVHPEAHPVYIQENYPQQPAVQEEPERKHAAPVASSKPSASSYWSVPEQSDFVKYIAHFGTDFAAIAAHMGTKTQTMIKNHYQRQIDGGNRAELEEAAIIANARRERGEDMGPPPTPTPINKRKYDNPGPTVQRNIAPHGDAMDVDDVPPAPQSQAPKHASPPQFHAQSRFGSSAQATPVPAPRVAPSPGPTPAVTPLGQAVANVRNLQQQQQQQAQQQQQQQHRMSIFGDSRSESRTGLPATTSFRASQQGTPTSQLTQSSRTVQDAHDSDFIRNLKEEQERAIRMQGQYVQQERQERMEPFQHRGSLHQVQAQHSPSTQPLNAPQERKPIGEARPASPPRGFFSSSGTARRSVGSPRFNSLTPAPVSSLANRMPYNPSPPKREEPRPSSGFSAPPAPPAATPAPAAEAPKRSNLLSILNNEPDEPKPQPKRVSDHAVASGMPQRTGSPAQHPLSGPSATPTMSSLPPSRRETFNQPVVPPPQSQMQRGPYGQPSSGPSPPTVKQEPHPASQGMQQQQPPPKQDWQSRMGQGQEPAPNSVSPAPALEREVRPYFSHHRASVLGPLNGPQRHNPSPPPHPLMSHSRTPSQSGQGPSQPPREQRGYLPKQQQAQHPVGTPSAQPLQPVSFPPPPTFAQGPPNPAQNHAHHAQNSSIGGPFGNLHQRTMSREEAIRHDQQAFAQQQAHQQAHQQAQQVREHEWRRMTEDRRMDEERRMREDHRMHEERRMQEIRMGEERMMQERRMHEERDISEGRRREAAYMAAQEERHRQHQQSFGAPRGGPPPQMHPAHFPGGFDQGQPRVAGGVGSLREQSMREAQDLMQQEERMRRDAAYRDHEVAQRRHEEMYASRRTPLGMGGYGGPPPSGAPPGPGRR